MEEGLLKKEAGGMNMENGRMEKENEEGRRKKEA